LIVVSPQIRNTPARATSPRIRNTHDFERFFVLTSLSPDVFGYEFSAMDPNPNLLNFCEDGDV
jgi:hypothetical protein